MINRQIALTSSYSWENICWWLLSQFLGSMIKKCSWESLGITLKNENKSGSSEFSLSVLARLAAARPPKPTPSMAHRKRKCQEQRGKGTRRKDWYQVIKVLQMNILHIMLTTFPFWKGQYEKKITKLHHSNLANIEAWESMGRKDDALLSVQGAPFYRAKIGCCDGPTPCRGDGCSHLGMCSSTPTKAIRLGKAKMESP